MLNRPERTSRKVHAESSVDPVNGQAAALRLEPNLVSFVSKVMTERMSRSQSRMAAKAHLGNRCEPSQPESVAFPDKEGGFRQVVFGCNGLKKTVLGPARQGAHSRRVSGKQSRRKRINLKYRKSHVGPGRSLGPSQIG